MSVAVVLVTYFRRVLNPLSVVCSPCRWQRGRSVTQSTMRAAKSFTSALKTADQTKVRVIRTLQRPPTHENNSTLHSTLMFRISRLSLLPSRASLARRAYASTTVQLPTEAHGHLPTSQSPITSKLHFFNSVIEEGKQIPTYRVLDGTGNLIDGAELPEVSLCLATNIHETYLQ